MAITERDTPGWKFFQRHIGFFYDKDVDGLLESDYTDDALVMSYDFAVRGREALRGLFTQYLEMIGDFHLTSVEHFNETDDAIVIEATMETSRAGERKVWDVFTMRNGKISHHFTGVR